MELILAIVGLSFQKAPQQVTCRYYEHGPFLTVDSLGVYLIS